MATLSMSSYSGDPDKKKKKKDVDACVGGECGPKKRGKMSLSKFSPTKKRYHLGTVKVDNTEKDPKPTGGMHMNMRELSAQPGDVRQQKTNSKSAVTAEQESTGRAAEKEIRKQKRALKLPRR